MVSLTMEVKNYSLLNVIGKFDETLSQNLKEDCLNFTRRYLELWDKGRWSGYQFSGLKFFPPLYNRPCTCPQMRASVQ